MLKLKKLQILGFKSFCDRTELKFPGDGITAIVGPNGCGKSNISDAISWVLGEQSAKSLRGARMEDVIFAGTRDRKPTGMAEVTLHLIDPEVYEGTVTEPEIDIQNEMPEEDDWDEASLRSSRAEEVDQYTEEVRPGQREEVEVHQPATSQQASAEGAVAPDGSAPAAENVTATPAEVMPDTAPTEVSPNEPAPVAQAAIQGGPQVVLKIRRRKFNTQKFGKGEIVVTRRLFRSGESEYLLNGKLCRLRDVHDIFMGTGLGPESYAIIEQGRIGQILSSKPTDRRSIIEEAAGITKFKTRKRLAEARLEDAKLNLNRVNDIFDEVTRQMNSLKRQAAKAERYAKLRDEMRAKLRVVLASRFHELQTQAADLEAQITALAEELHIKGDAVQVLDNEHGERTQRGYAVESEARQTRERLNQINLEMDRATARRRNNDERCAELVARSAGAEAEISQTGEQLARLEGELGQNREVLASAAADVAAAQEQLRTRQDDSRAAANTLSEVERQQEQQRRAMMEAVAVASNVRNRITQAEERIAALEREALRLQTEITNANQQVETFGGQRGQISFEFESASQKVASMADQITATRASLQEKRQAEAEGKRYLDTMRAEFATLQGKRASLDAIIAEHGYSTDSVRRLFQSGALSGGRAPAGVLADFLEVDDRFENVVDDFLRDELNFVVVKSWDAADEGMRLLRTDVDGRATFLVHPSDSQAKFSFVAEESLEFEANHHGIVPLKNCVRVLNGFGRSLEVVLPKLGNGYIVPDSQTGRTLALENPDAFFLAHNGECFHNVTVTGGKQRSEGPLSMKRDLREVQRNMEGIERALRDQEARVALLGKEIGELTSLLDNLEAEKREAEKQAMTSGHSLQQLDQEMSRVRERMTTYESEMRRVASERSDREQFIAQQRQELDGCELRKIELETEMAAAQENLQNLRIARDQAAQATSEAMATVAGLQERHRGASASVSRIEAMVTEVHNRVNALRGQLQSAAAEKAEREQENERLAAQLVDWNTERETAQAREAELLSESEQVRSRIAAIEDELKAARAELDQLRDRRGELSAHAAKLQSDLEHMAETCVQELSTTKDDLLADEMLPRLTGEELAAEDTAYREMRTRLDNMGPVNILALEEYKEVAQRHEFLETQRKDLLESIENTQNTIREIEAVSRQKFEEAFTAINETFQHTFKKLFGGGQAFMRLTDEENTAESGIDIVASPPGKKLQNVLLLSGGEKALTALSLLVGIFKYAPSPFCILDEVDAPLDEINVGRFNELVKEMSMGTQFIIITHSKKTMSIAPAMYGVTMQEPGVSKVVSVRFGGEEKKEIRSATA
ncbi:MAG: chromosome segregation protein SMC [Terriglobia bacterium]|nr:chromosome segregation protein SMC [Terriglobia bacterium]